MNESYLFNKSRTHDIFIVVKVDRESEVELSDGR